MEGYKAIISNMKLKDFFSLVLGVWILNTYFYIFKPVISFPQQWWIFQFPEVRTKRMEFYNQDSTHIALPALGMDFYK